MTAQQWRDTFADKCQGFSELPSILPPVKRIIVLGDLHGDWSMTIKSLKIGKLIDNKNKWIGGDTVVVQLGDQIDRCRFTGVSCNKSNTHHARIYNTTLTNTTLTNTTSVNITSPNINYTNELFNKLFNKLADKTLINKTNIKKNRGINNIFNGRRNNIFNGGKNSIFNDETTSIFNDGTNNIFDDEINNTYDEVYDEASDFKILNFFTDLHKQAQLEGGAVYSIIGNHELMNVNGDMRYVSPANFNEFKDYKKHDGTIIPAGIEARKYMFAPGNPIADFLGCTRQLSLIIGSNLFVHAGILPEIAKKYEIQDMNQIISLYLWDKLKNPLQYDDLLKASDYSPLWNRQFGSVNIPTETCNLYMNTLKTRYKVGKIFIGHTPQLKSGISSTCQERIWLADYGASAAFNTFDNNFIFNNKRSKLREAQVLEILNDGEQINILK